MVMFYPVFVVTVSFVSLTMIDLLNEIVYL